MQYHKNRYQKVFRQFTIIKSAWITGGLFWITGVQKSTRCSYWLCSSHCKSHNIGSELDSVQVFQFLTE